MSTSRQTLSDVRMVSPALERYMLEALFGDLWKRPDLTPRDRSIVALAVLIGRNQTVELRHYLNLALAHGVTPAEVSEIITHLAFYSGWSNAMPAVAVTKSVFAQHGIGADQLPAASPPPSTRPASGGSTCYPRSAGCRPVSPGLVEYTGDLLFRDLRLRPDLAPRDRSLVPVSALIGAGQVAQIPFHLNRAMDNGLTKAQASEVLTHVAFYECDVGYAGREGCLGRSARMTKLIEIKPNGSRPSAKGPAQNFTGSVVIDPLFDASEHTHATGGLVTFEPGARTAWHTHPAGQTLIAASGTGWVKEWGGERQQIHPGDAIWIPPNVKHWHGAIATNHMSHIAITNMHDGRNVDWLEHVSDEDHAGQPRG